MLFYFNFRKAHFVTVTVHYKQIKDTFSSNSNKKLQNSANTNFFDIPNTEEQNRKTEKTVTLEQIYYAFQYYFRLPINLDL